MMKINKNQIKMLSILRHALKLAIKRDKKTGMADKVFESDTDGHTNEVPETQNFALDYTAVTKYIEKATNNTYSGIDEMIDNADDLDLVLNVKVEYHFNSTQIADIDQEDIIWDATLTHQDLLDRINKVLGKVTVK